MEVHKFEKIWIVAALVLIVGFIATVTYGAVGAGVQMVNDEGGTLDPEAVDSHPKFGDPHGEWVPGKEGEHYRVYVVARQFNFQPDPIRVPANTKVTFYVTSPDVVHGFEVVGTNVNAMVIPGQISKITTRFPEATDYGLVCNEYCGAFHHTMAGKIQVVPKDEFSTEGS